MLSQIEQGLSSLLREKVKFEDLVEAAEGMLPVVMLDGFDELIQAAAPTATTTWSRSRSSRTGSPARAGPSR